MFQNKLAIPRVGSNIVRRKKIEEKPRLLPEYKLAFLSAPAGYGKTTAVADHLLRLLEREEEDKNLSVIPGRLLLGF